MSETREDEVWQELHLPEVAKEIAAGHSIRETDSDTGRGSSDETPEARQEANLRAELEQLPRVELSELGVVPAPRDELVVLGQLGKGGMGIVERARQRSLGREVAIKRVRRDKKRVRTALKLLDEARVAGSLEHPNIIPIHALAADVHGDPILVMKRVEGVRWSELLKNAQHPHWKKIDGDRLRFHLETLAQVCRALELAHSRGFVHRDIKPENVMVGDYGEVYLLDWELALELIDGQAVGEQRGMRVVGTPAYMAPEMINQRPITARTDVYLLGATLHVVLAGRPRHKGERFFDLAVQIHASDPVAFDDKVPKELAAICNRATARDPAERYPTARAFREAITGYLEHRASAALSGEAAERLLRLEALLAEAKRSAAQEVEARKLAVECRFGFTQALDMWAGNAEALRGRARALQHTITLEIESRHEDAARAALAELREVEEGPAVSALAGRVDILGAELKAERKQVAELKSFAHERDVRVQSRVRGKQLLVLAIIALLVGVGVAVARRVFGVELTYAIMLPTGVLPPVVSGSLLVFSRIRNQAVNRKLIFAFVTMTSAAGIVRWIAWRAGVSPYAALAFELLANASGAIITATFVDRRLLRPAAMCAACALAATVLFDWTVELTIAGTLGGLAWAALIWLRSEEIN